MNNIEKNVMARVRRIYYLRMVVNPTLLKVYGAAILFGVLASFVSLSNVYANMPSLLVPGRFVQFILNAVLHTEAVVQITVLALTTLFGLMMWDLLRNLRQHQSFIHI